MNEKEFDLAAREWLDDGPTRMSDHGVLSTLEAIHVTRQRRAIWPAWRATPVNIFARVAAAGALVVAVGLLAVNVVPRQPDGASVGGTPSATPSATASATPLDFPLTRTFVSPTYGYSFRTIDRGGITPATKSWDPAHQPLANAGFDKRFDYQETGLALGFAGASTAIPAGVSVDAWIDEYVTPVAAGGCGIPRSEQAEITIDGQPGRVATCHETGVDLVPNELRQIEATVVDGGRLYLFRQGYLNPDGRAIFDAWAATIRLHPEDAAAPPASPSS
jgi:hypothetical protein